MNTFFGKNLSKKTKNWLKLLLGLAVLILIIVGIWLFLKQPVKIPTEFLAARSDGAAISQRIVELTSGINQKIKEINFFDLNGDSAQALALINETKEKNQETSQEAFKLSEQMQKMIESLGQIASFNSREKAMEAINLELSLISNFITYTNNLNSFLVNLNKAIASNQPEYRRLMENDLEQISQKTWLINNLNQQFLEKMKQFDSSL